jgi:hypothetical protein
MDLPEPSASSAPPDAPANPERTAPHFYTASSLRPEDSLGYLLRSVLSSIRNAVDTQLQGRGLTFAQCVPLYKISRAQNTTVAALARTLEADPAAVTRLLDRLEAKELVVRELTPVLAETLNAHLAGFSTDEWRQLVGLLQRMLANGEAARQ